MITTTGYLYAALIVSAVLQVAGQSAAAPFDPPKRPKHVADAWIIGSIVGKRRVATEKVLGKPIWPTKRRQDVILKYRVKGCLLVAVTWRTDYADSEMRDVEIAFESPPATWQQALRRVGYSVDGVHLIDDKLENVKGLRPGYGVWWYKTSVLFMYDEEPTLSESQPGNGLPML